MALPLSICFQVSDPLRSYGNVAVCHDISLSESSLIAPYSGMNSSDGRGNSADASTQQLEELFRRNMDLAIGGGEPLIRQGLSAPTVERSPVNYSISQHYTHSGTYLPSQSHPTGARSCLQGNSPERQSPELFCYTKILKEKH